jgi:hypothetical protein
MAAASSTSSSGYTLFQPTPSQEQVDALIAVTSGHGGPVADTLLLMGFW